MERFGARSTLRTSDDQRIALAPTATKRGRPGAQAAPLELQGDGEHETRAAGSDGMSKRDRATVDVDALLVKLEHPGRVEGDGGKSLVDLHQVEIACLKAGLLQRVAQSQ